MERHGISGLQSRPNLIYVVDRIDSLTVDGFDDIVDPQS
jgi:hypothetical protein